MATQDLLKDTVTVAQIGDWGVRIGDEWCGLNEPLKSHDFIPGNTYDVLYRKGKPTDKYPNGKKYISQIVGEGKATTASTLVPTQASVPAQAIPAKASVPSTDKDIRILRQGVYQAALHSPSLAGFAATTTEYLALVKNVAEDIIKAIENK